MGLDQLLLYRRIGMDPLVKEMECFLNQDSWENTCTEDKKKRLYDIISQFIAFSSSYGFEGNLWHTYITFLLVNDENSYSIACERHTAPSGSIQVAALHDFQICKALFDFDFRNLQNILEEPFLSLLTNYKGNENTSFHYSKSIRNRMMSLAKELANAFDIYEFQDKLSRFYKEFGVGDFGLHKAFRIKHVGDQVTIVPILKTANVSFDDLIGYEAAKKKLFANTEAFVSGKRANNCLLYGDAGTGKSTSIKAILNAFYDKGLRIIEIYKHQFQDLNEVISQIQHRNYRFIIYMDDLSFEEFEIEYKYLKAIIEGGLEEKQNNILIYATSNRRHLIRETFRDKEERDAELHTNDTVQEKLSLFARFGISIYFGGPSKKEFQEIVKTLAKKEDIQMSEEELLQEANKWELSQGGLSGRSAQQLIDHLVGNASSKDAISL